MKILIIEDELSLQQSIKTYLESQNFVVEVAGTFEKANEKINIYSYDCCLVDLNLPDGSGLNLIEGIKKHNQKTGIIIITAKDSLDDRIKGLEMGSDDYLVKPFHLAELSARINALIRRVRFDGENKIDFEGLTIFPDERIVTFHEKKLDLTRKEFDLLLFMSGNINKVLTKESIAEHLWGDFMDNSDSFDFVYNHVKNLKRKMTHSNCGDYIKNVYGVGYKFEIP